MRRSGANRAYKSENRIQQECYMWFTNTYPELRGCLFAVPNGGGRSAREGQLLKETGTYAGVSDMLLMYQSFTFCFELKNKFGVQSVKQKKWQAHIEKQGFKYFLVRSLDEFKKIVKEIILIPENVANK